MTKPLVGFDGQLPGFLMNGLIFSFSCQLNRNAWKLERIPTTKSNVLSVVLGRLRANPKRYLPTLKNIIRFAQERADLCPPQYFIFGVFIIANFSLPCFLWSYDLMHPDIAILLRLIGAALCVVLLIKSHLSERFQGYIPIYWQFTVFFCLPFSTTYMLFDSQGSTWWLMNMALSLMLSSIILDWINFILITVVGVSLGWVFYVLEYGFGTITLEPSGIYVLCFVFIIGIVFSRAHYIAHLRRQVNNLKALAGSIAHELRTPLASIETYGKGIENTFLKKFVNC